MKECCPLGQQRGPDTESIVSFKSCHLSLYQIWAPFVRPYYTNKILGYEFLSSSNVATKNLLAMPD